MIRRFLLFVSLLLIIAIIIVYFIPMNHNNRAQLMGGLGLAFILAIGGSIWLLISGMIIRLILVVAAVAALGLILYYYVL